MSQEGRLDRSGLGVSVEGRQAAQDAWRAEPALAGAVVEEGFDQRIAHREIEAIDGGHRPPGNPPQRRDAGHPRLAVDQHRAATALSLWAAPVFYRRQTKLIPKRVEQRAPRVLQVEGPAVDGQLQQRLS